MTAQDNLNAEGYQALTGGQEAPKACQCAGLREALQEIKAMQPAVLERLRKGDYIFDKSPIKKPVTEADRWQELAFWLYTDLCQANLIATQALDGERE